MEVAWPHPPSYRSGTSTVFLLKILAVLCLAGDLARAFLHFSGKGFLTLLATGQEAFLASQATYAMDDLHRIEALFFPSSGSHSCPQRLR